MSKEAKEKVFVAIPSNRVKRSKSQRVALISGGKPSSQSPQIGSSVQSEGDRQLSMGQQRCRNPLKSGQAFKAADNKLGWKRRHPGRNPLKSGQAFKVAVTGSRMDSETACRNPLKSGQAFKGKPGRERCPGLRVVAIPSNRVKRSKLPTSSSKS